VNGGSVGRQKISVVVEEAYTQAFRLRARWRLRRGEALNFCARISDSRDRSVFDSHYWGEAGATIIEVSRHPLDRQLPPLPAVRRQQRLATRDHADDLAIFDDLERPQSHTGMTPTVRARVTGDYEARGFEMEWSEEESTTTTWGHERSQPAIQYATSFIGKAQAVERVPSHYRAPEYPPPPPPEPRVYAQAQTYAPQPQVRTDQVQVVRYQTPAPGPAPSLHFEAPHTPLMDTWRPSEELEPDRVLGGVVWTVLGAAGLFCAVLFMRLIVSDATEVARTSAEPARAPSALVAAVTAPSAAQPQAPQVAEPTAAAVAPAPLEVVTKPEPAMPQPTANVAAPKITAPKHAPKHSAPKSTPRRSARPAPKPVKRVARVTTAPVAAAGAAISNPPSAPRGAATGTLRVNSLPWSEVFVDGKPVGTTPQMGLLLPAGRHKLKLVNPQLEMTKVLSVDIEPGQVVTKTINLSQ
jgi:hypothetical protein